MFKDNSSSPRYYVKVATGIPVWKDYHHKVPLEHKPQYRQEVAVAILYAASSSRKVNMAAMLLPFELSIGSEELA